MIAAGVAHVKTGVVPLNESGKANPEALVYWCGQRVAPSFEFQDATHVLLALKHGTAITPCAECLRAMFRVLAEELGISMWA